MSYIWSFFFFVLVIGGPFAIALEDAYGQTVGLVVWVLIIIIWIYAAFFKKK